LESLSLSVFFHDIQRQPIILCVFRGPAIECKVETISVLSCRNCAHISHPILIMHRPLEWMVSRERIVTPYHGQPSRDSNRKRNGLAARSVKDYSQEGRSVARRLADSQPPVGPGSYGSIVIKGGKL